MTSKQPTPMPAGMTRGNRPKAPSAPPKITKIKPDYTSNINLEIETTLLEDGSFWYRMKEIIGSKAGEWNEWVLLERSVTT